MGNNIGRGGKGHGCGNNFVTSAETRYDHGEVESCEYRNGVAIAYPVPMYFLNMSSNAGDLGDL